MSRQIQIRIAVECDRCGDQLNSCYDCGASYFRPGNKIDEDPDVYALDGQDLCERCYRRDTCTNHSWNVQSTGTGGAYCTVCRIRADVAITLQAPTGGAS